MRNVLPIILLGVVILAGVGFFVSMKQSSLPAEPIRLQEVEPTAPKLISGSVPTNLTSSYNHSSGVYAFLYPNDYTLDSQGDDQYIRIIKRGPSDRPQSEISDGVLMVFEALDLQKQSLEEWVDAQLKASAEAGTSEVIQPKKATMLNGYSGFTYQTQGLGSSTYVVVQKTATSQSAVSITFLVADPQNKGYQSEVEAILATLELKK